MKYMLLMNATKKDWGSFGKMKPEEIQKHIGFMMTLNQDLKASGELVVAEGLTGPEDAKVIRAGKNGAPVITDGPFPEAKEFLAGWWILDVKSPERAYEIAARISTAPGPNGEPMIIPVEVRPVGTAPKT